MFLLDLLFWNIVDLHQVCGMYKAFSYWQGFANLVVNHPSEFHNSKFKEHINKLTKMFKIKKELKI